MRYIPHFFSTRLPYQCLPYVGSTDSVFNHRRLRKFKVDQQDWKSSRDKLPCIMHAWSWVCLPMLARLPNCWSGSLEQPCPRPCWRDFGNSTLLKYSLSSTCRHRLGPSTQTKPLTVSSLTTLCPFFPCVRNFLQSIFLRSQFTALINHIYIFVVASQGDSQARDGETNVVRVAFRIPCKSFHSSCFCAGKSGRSAYEWFDAASSCFQHAMSGGPTGAYGAKWCPDWALYSLWTRRWDWQKAVSISWNESAPEALQNHDFLFQRSWPPWPLQFPGTQVWVKSKCLDICDPDLFKVTAGNICQMSPEDITNDHWIPAAQSQDNLNTFLPCPYQTYYVAWM